MFFNRHTNLEGLHAPFGASKSSWLRYSDEKIVEVTLIPGFLDGAEEA